MTAAPRGRRVFAGFLLAAFAVLASGCVYLRLLALKRQLADFDRHFSVATDEGVRLAFLSPVLLADDLRFLGFEPASVARTGETERWQLRWRKQPAANVRERGAFEIAFDLEFADKLTALHIPERYFAALPKELLIRSLKGLGTGSVSRQLRVVQGTVDVAAAGRWPTRESLGVELGVPTEETAADGRINARYLFVSTDPAHKGKDIDLHLVFGAATGRLLQIRGRLPVGQIKLDFTAGKSAP